jgi:hypothetical protein
VYITPFAANLGTDWYTAFSLQSRSSKLRSNKTHHTSRQFSTSHKHNLQAEQRVQSSDEPSSAVPMQRKYPAQKDAHLKVVTAWESFLFRLSHVTRSTQQLMAAIFPAYLFWHIYSLTTQDSWRKLTAVWEIQL